MVSGKLNGIKKKHIVVSAYLPPNYVRDQNREFFECLSDAILEVKSKFPDSWITVGGDWNRRSLSPITDAIPDLVEIKTPPTRGMLVWTYCSQTTLI